MARADFFLVPLGSPEIAVYAAGKSPKKDYRMREVSDYVNTYARDRYGHNVVRVDAESIKLRDGTEIFTTSLYAELSAKRQHHWEPILDDWFSMLDLIRARIANTG